MIECANDDNEAMQTPTKQPPLIPRSEASLNIPEVPGSEAAGPTTVDPSEQTPEFGAVRRMWEENDKSLWDERRAVTPPISVRKSDHFGTVKKMWEEKDDGIAPDSFDGIEANKMRSPTPMKEAALANADPSSTFTDDQELEADAMGEPVRAAQNPSVDDKRNDHHGEGGPMQAGNEYIHATEDLAVALEKPHVMSEAATVLDATQSGDSEIGTKNSNNAPKENVPEGRNLLPLLDIDVPPFDSSIKPDADMIVLMEDTDLMPCATEPELDGVPVLGDLRQYDEQSNDRGYDLDHQVLREVDYQHSPPKRHDHSSHLGHRTLAMSPSEDATVASDQSTMLKASEETIDEAQRNEIPPDASPLPDPALVLEKGSIFTRASLRSIMMKNWHRTPTYWVRYGSTSLYIFRSENDFQDWLQNPHHAGRQRDYLVKVKFEFLNDMKSKENIKGYRMTDTKLKLYGKNGPQMHQFKLERLTDIGVSIAAAFASPDSRDVDDLRAAINNCLKECSK